MLQQLNVQIVEAGKNGDKVRVNQLQNRFVEIQKKWNVQPAKGNNPAPVQRPPVVVPPKPAVVQPQKPPVVPQQNPQGNQPVGGDVAQAESAAVTLTNKERQKQGLSPLRVDAKLTASARDHSNDMNRLNFFSHTSTVNGKAEFDQRARNFGTTANAENIAKNPGSPEDVLNSWMGSAGHRQNILTPNYTRIGIGKAGPYWTMMLGN